MTDKELHRLRRDDLLQILLNQQKQIEELTAALEARNKELEDRSITIQESGSIAEAALRLNGVFEKAQAAANQYLEQVRQNAEAQRREAEEIVREAQRSADEIIRKARQEASRLTSADSAGRAAKA